MLAGASFERFAFPEYFCLVFFVVVGIVFGQRTSQWRLHKDATQRTVW
jgi:hypothetical protein